tara:strand:- start:290 stop:418 length:129 start_codon:yes stop_codon:yes gene_type:complete
MDRILEGQAEEVRALPLGTLEMAARTRNQIKIMSKKVIPKAA